MKRKQYSSIINANTTAISLKIGIYNFIGSDDIGKSAEYMWRYRTAKKAGIVGLAAGEEAYV